MPAELLFYLFQEFEQTTIERGTRTKRVEVISWGGVI
jgi:hypothetical protein